MVTQQYHYFITIPRIINYEDLKLHVILNFQFQFYLCDVTRENSDCNKNLLYDIDLSALMDTNCYIMIICFRNLELTKSFQTW